MPSGDALNESFVPWWKSVMSSDFCNFAGNSGLWECNSWHPDHSLTSCIFSVWFFFVSLMVSDLEYITLFAMLLWPLWPRDMYALQLWKQSSHTRPEMCRCVREQLGSLAVGLTALSLCSLGHSTLCSAVPLPAAGWPLGEGYLFVSGHDRLHLLQTWQRARRAHQSAGTMSAYTVPTCLSLSRFLSIFLELPYHFPVLKMISQRYSNDPTKVA